MTKFKKWLGNEKNFPVTVPLIAIIMGFLVGVIIMVFTGLNPGSIFTSILRAVLGVNFNSSGKILNLRYFGEYFVFAMPIILTGLSVAFAFRTGLFNIGAEGQLMVGSFTAIALGILLPGPDFLILIVMIIAGTLAGGIWGLIPGYLKARFNVHEVVVTIMLNYVALFLTSYYYKQLPGSDNSKTVELVHGRTLQSDFLTGITNNSRLHWGFILVIIAIVAFWYIIEKTTFGYELRAVGYNKDAAKYAGMKVERNSALSMMISGMFSGLAGVIISLGTFGYGRVLLSAEGYGFDGIAVALVGGNTALGSLFGGLLFGALNAAKPIMQTQGVPRDIAIIISSMIVLFVAMQNGIRRVLKKIGGDK